MKKLTKRLSSILVALLCLLSLAACAPAAQDNEVSSKTDSISSNPGVEEDVDSLSCSLTIRCDTLLEHLSDLTEGKAELVPEDGLLLLVENAPFTQGESAFDVLKRELQSRRMHLEFSESPVYDSAYIEGICNLYEYDCGELSGWVYRVNGETLSYGCSKYLLSDGDQVEFLYTCDLGDDL